MAASNLGPEHYAKVAQALRTLTSLILFLSKDVLLDGAHNGYHPVGIKGKSLGGQYFAKAKRKKNYVEATFSDATSAAGVSNNMGRLSGNQTRAVQPVLGRDKARPPGPTKDDALRGGLRRSMFRG